MKSYPVFIVVLGLLFAIVAAGCTTSDPLHETASSKPLNKKEEIEYNAALIRCHKTGGTRIVKINQNLRCF